jgi:CTP synthase
VGPACWSPDSLAAKAYGTTEISERHRHRYEFNREYEAVSPAAGLRLTGTTPDATYVEIVEIPDHPFFLGCQFHPEFKSKPLEPHPLFRATRIAAAIRMEMVDSDTEVLQIWVRRKRLDLWHQSGESES